MADMISKLTGEQALKVIKRLARKEGGLREAILAEAMNVLNEIDLDETADEVAAILDLIDVEDCWDRAGSSRDGYTSPGDAATELIEEEIEPFVDQIERYHAIGLLEQEAVYCMGVLLGLYRYERESKSEFRQWAEDIPGDVGRGLLDEWRKRNPDRDRVNAMHEFIRARCPEWADWLRGS